MTDKEKIERAALARADDLTAGHAVNGLRHCFTIGFIEGAQFGIKLERGRAKVLVEALEWYAEGPSSVKAEEALEKYRGQK